MPLLGQLVEYVAMKARAWRACSRSWPHHQLSAYAHLIARAIEGAMLAVGILFLLLLVPRFMAVWGLVGYAIFLVGAALEVIGYGVSLALSVPGGLFE